MTVLTVPSDPVWTGSGRRHVGNTRVEMAPADPTDEAVERARLIRERADQGLRRASELVRQVDELNDQVRTVRGAPTDDVEGPAGT